ncbi:MAG: Uma2 family endonuclease [Anaerolineae bacterium]|nr:Uma2 family endonuclease [Anaerolineae bacterium]
MSVDVTISQTQLITGEALAAMGDVGRCELVAGKIVKMSPTGYEHGNIEIKVGARLYNFVSERKLGKVQVGEVGIYTRRNPDTVRAADVLFISNERYAQRQSPSYLDVAPELVVEIISPDDRWSEINQKLREYFAAGIDLIWVIDPKSRSVHVYRSLTDIREFSADETLSGEEILPGLSISINELFDD